MATESERIKTLEEEIKTLKNKLSDKKWKEEVDDREERAEKVVSSLEKLTNTISGMFRGINDWVGKAWGDADDAASKYAKTIGASARGMETLRKSTIDFVTDNSIGARFNTSMKELIQLQQTYNAQISRSVTMTNMQLENLAAMRAIMGDEQTIKFTANFEKFGLDANAAADMFTEIFNESASKGIVLEKYSKNFLDNIDMAQKFTFQDGINGLKRMAEQATAIKWDMQQTASFADKVSTVEGSIKTGARLSLLGGPFAQFANPMGMLYESLNDVESLQDRIVQMFGNLGRWDSAKQQVDISAFNRLRLKEASEAMGISFEKAIESVNAQGRRREVERQLGRRTDLNAEVREMILNTAQIDRKTGKAYVTIGGEQRSLDKVSNYDLKVLQNLNKSQAQDVKDIAEMLRSYTDMVQGREKQMQSVKAQFQENSGIGSLMKNANKILAESNNFLRTIASATMTMALMGAAGNLWSSGRGVGKAFGYGKSGGYSGRGTSSLRGGVGGSGGSGIGGSSSDVFKPTRMELAHQRAQRLNTPGLSKAEKDIIKKQYADYEAKLKADAEWANRRASIKPINHSLSKEQRLAQLGDKAQSKYEAVKRGVRKRNIATTMPKYAVSAGLAIGVGGHLGANALYNMSNGDDSKASNILGDVVNYGSMGASFGAMFGLPGLLIGAGVGALGGAIAGGVQAAGKKRKDIATEKLRQMGIWLSGDYDGNELEAIIGGQRAVNRVNGLMDKMKQQGDLSVYESLKLSKGGLILGPSHSNGGVAVGRSGIEVEGGEFVVNKEATSKNLSVLNAINQDNIKPIEPMGKQMKVNETYVNGGYADRIDVSPLDLSVNGSLKLDLGGQQTQIDAKQLLNNSEFVRNLTNVLSKEINIRSNKRFDTQSYYKKF